MNKHLDHRVVIIGAGISGLMIGYRLAEYGLKPLVIERSFKAACGSTTRNQGWLHVGALHAQSIPDVAAALRVSKRCQYGHSQILKLCPEAVEDRSLPTIAVTTQAVRVSEIVDRWRAAGVEHRSISSLDLRQIAPELNINEIAASWIVNDAVINTSILCTKLVALLRQMGGDVWFGCEVAKASADELCIHNAEGAVRNVLTDFVVIACGYGTVPLLRKHWGRSLPMRYWKSHLLIAPRLMDANIYCVDPQETSFMQHGQRTLIGMLHDNIACAEPSHDVDFEQIERMKRAVAKLTYISGEEHIVPVACVKVDIADTPGLSRNLDVEMVELSPRLLCAFPGKMTEAPFLADLVLRKFLATTNSLLATSRPIDEVDFTLLPPTLEISKDRMREMAG